MKATSFYYKGYYFKPIGNISGNFCQKSKFTTWAYKLDIKDYNWQDFYKVAKKHHASCDIFEVDGKQYIPCTGAIIGIYNNPKIKGLEEYSRWYH